MRKIVPAVMTALLISGSVAHAGGMPEMQPEEIIENTSSSAGGIIVPLLLLILIAAAVSGGSGGEPIAG